MQRSTCLIYLLGVGTLYLLQPFLHWTKRCFLQRSCEITNSSFLPEYMSLRLTAEVPREKNCAGHLEVFYNGTWGSVGSSGMPPTTVGVVCRQLGCADNGTVKPTSSDKTPSRLMWVDSVQCPKGVDSLWQCPSSPWKQRRASPSEESWITCDSEYPLSVSILPLHCHL